MSGCGCNNNQKGGGSKKCRCKKCRRSVQRGGSLWSSIFGDNKLPQDQGMVQQGQIQDQGMIQQDQGMVQQDQSPYLGTRQLPYPQRLENTPSALNQGVLGQQGGRRKSRKTRKGRKTRRVKKSRKYRR